MLFLFIYLVLNYLQIIILRNLLRYVRYANILAINSDNFVSSITIFYLLNFFFKTDFIYLFIYLFLWLCWVFVSVRGLFPVAASGGHSSSWCAGLSLSRPFVAEHRLQMRRLSSCGARAQLLCGMWDLPRPGFEPVSPASAGRLSTTVPPGKPYLLNFISVFSGWDFNGCLV